MTEETTNLDMTLEQMENMQAMAEQIPGKIEEINAQSEESATDQNLIEPNYTSQESEDLPQSTGVFDVNGNELSPRQVAATTPTTRTQSENII
jgi:hypothetical protein